MQISRQASGLYVSGLQVLIQQGFVKYKPAKSPKEPHVLAVKKHGKNAL